MNISEEITKCNQEKSEYFKRHENQPNYFTSGDYKKNDTVYGIHSNDTITFLTLEAAEDFLLKEYPEYCSGKDAAYDFCENMIWEETKENLMREVN